MQALLKNGQMLTVMLEAPDDFAGFRQAARALLALGAAPDDIHWRWNDTLATRVAEGDLFANSASPAEQDRVLSPDALDRLAPTPGRPVHIRKPQLAVLRDACCHRNPGRFALCYRWLWRVLRTPRLAIAAAFGVLGLLFISLTTRLPVLADLFDVDELALSGLMLMMVLLAGVLSIVARAAAEARGQQVDEAADAAMRAAVEGQIEAESLPMVLSGMLYDDGVIDPRDTRTVLGICLSAIATNPIKGTSNFGVFRM